LRHAACAVPPSPVSHAAKRPWRDPHQICGWGSNGEAANGGAGPIRPRGCGMRA